MENINLLGIKLQNRYVRESLDLTERFLCEGALHTILYLTTTVLLEAAKNKEEKAWMEAADLMLWGDEEILKAAEITSKSRYREVCEKDYLKNFLKGIAKAHKSILVISDTEEHAESLKWELWELQDKITVAGALAVSETEKKSEDIINEINMIAPTVIVARMPFPVQRRWLAESKPYMNAEIWLGLPEDFHCIWKKEKTAEKMLKQVMNAVFNKEVHKYKK